MIRNSADRPTALFQICFKKFKIVKNNNMARWKQENNKNNDDNFTGTLGFRLINGPFVQFNSNNKLIS